MLSGRGSRSRAWRICSPVMAGSRSSGDAVVERFEHLTTGQVHGITSSWQPRRPWRTGLRGRADDPGQDHQGHPAGAPGAGSSTHEDKLRRTLAVVFADLSADKPSFRVEASWWLSATSPAPTRRHYHRRSPGESRSRHATVNLERVDQWARSRPNSLESGGKDPRWQGGAVN